MTVPDLDCFVQNMSNIRKKKDEEACVSDFNTIQVVQVKQIINRRLAYITSTKIWMHLNSSEVSC